MDASKSQQLKYKSVIKMAISGSVLQLNPRAVRPASFHLLKDIDDDASRLLRFAPYIITLS